MFKHLWWKTYIVLSSPLLIFQVSQPLHAHPILKITRNDNRPNWTPLSPITITKYNKNNKSQLFVFSDIDDCAPNPCQNGGTCMDGVASYNCTCRTGFNGSKCQNSKN